MGAVKGVLTPQFYWAQRKDQIFLTVDVPNVKKDTAQVSLSDEGKVYFKGFGGNVNHEVEYLLDIMLLKGIKKDESKAKINARSVVFKIKKADSGPYWERLLKEGGRNVHCKIDWDNWIDEDEEDEVSALGSFGESKDHEDMDFVADGSSSDEEDSSPASETTL